MHRTSQVGRKIGPIFTASVVTLLAYITLEGIAEAIVWGALGVLHVSDAVLFTILGLILVVGIWPSFVLFRDTMKAEQALFTTRDSTTVGL
jgi:hypothetical protein